MTNPDTVSTDTPRASETVVSRVPSEPVPSLPGDTGGSTLPGGTTGSGQGS